MSSSDMGELLIRLKLVISKVFCCSDCAILYYNQADQLLYGLNPTYSQKDLLKVKTLELNKFSSTTGITSQILEDRPLYYSENPRAELNFTSQVDNLTPVFGLTNLTIIKLESDDGRTVGVIQIINQDLELNQMDYLVGQPTHLYRLNTQFISFNVVFSRFPLKLFRIIDCVFMIF